MENNMYGDWRKDCWYLVGIDEEGDWTFYIKDKFGITDFKEHATCFKSPLEAKAAKAWLESELEKLGYPEDENVNSVEKWIVAYYDEKSGCLFDAVTDKYLFNYDGKDEPEELEEATSLLESAGYRVVRNEVLNEAINNPDDPATNKQLWALFCIYKKDFRNQGLTKGEASELIKKGANERPAKSSGKSLDAKICEHIETVLKPKLDKKMEAAFGNQSVVGDADLEGNLIPGRKRYKFFGGGCGFAWIKYDKRNKKLGEVTDRYIDIYKDKYWDKYCKEYISKFKEKEMGAVLSQDLDVQYTIKQAALDFAESIGINIGKAYVDGRLD